MASARGPVTTWPTAAFGPAASSTTKPSGTCRSTASATTPGARSAATYANVSGDPSLACSTVPTRFNRAWVLDVRLRRTRSASAARASSSPRS